MNIAITVEDQQVFAGREWLAHLKAREADRRDCEIMHKAAACEGGAHHVWLATQGMNVYERMAFDRM